jgi:hypothetical protein
MNQSRRGVLEARGWKLIRENQPGIYVRKQEIPAFDAIDWTSEPIAMINELQVRQERQERHSRRKMKKHRRAQTQKAMDLLRVAGRAG